MLPPTPLASLQTSEYAPHVWRPSEPGVAGRGLGICTWCSPRAEWGVAC